MGRKTEKEETGLATQECALYTFMSSRLPQELPWVQTALFPASHMPVLRTQVGFSLLQPLPKTTILLSWIQFFRASSEGPAFLLYHPELCILPPWPATSLHFFLIPWGLWSLILSSTFFTPCYYPELLQGAWAPSQNLDSLPPPSPMHLGASSTNRTAGTASTRLQGSLSEM